MLPSVPPIRRCFRIRSTHRRRQGEASREFAAIDDILAQLLKLFPKLGDNRFVVVKVEYQCRSGGGDNERAGNRILKLRAVLGRDHQSARGLGLALDSPELVPPRTWRLLRPERTGR
jgi:hypothetical protein